MCLNLHHLFSEGHSKKPISTLFEPDGMISGCFSYVEVYLSILGSFM
jgi:hypothetical protein